METGKWTITSELFAIPHDERYILYAPLAGAITSVNKAGAIWVAQARKDGTITTIPDSLIKLREIGIIESTHNSESLIQDKPIIKVEPFRPTGLIILTTSFCNFRCVYCYASADANFRQVNLDVAKAAIKMVIANALEIGELTVDIAFHGGGEPTTSLPFIKKCVNYANEIADGRIDIAPSIVTNGYLSKRQIEWLGQNMYSIQISLDGPADIQNTQRPLVSGKATFDRVVHTIHRFVELGVPNLLIKATIPQPSVHRLPEIARFFCETFPLDRFHFGPVLEFGRSKETGFIEPKIIDFLKYALEAQSIAATYDKQIVISGAQETFPNLRHEFCGLTEPNFAITVDGKISGCYEILEPNDPRSDTFHYGYFSNGEFYFDLEKIAQLRNRQHILADKCHRCFARWQCAGDCQIRWYDEDSGNYNDDIDFRCALNRALIKRELIKVLEQSENVPVHIPIHKMPVHNFVD